MAVVINGTTGITSVNGTAGAPSVTGTDTDTGIVYGTNTLSLATGGTTAVTVDSSQNVGIGTSSPTNLLHVSTTNAGANNYNLRLMNLGTTVSTAVGALWTTKDAGSNNISSAIISTTTDATSGAGGTALSFSTTSSGSLTERARIDSSGNVGIGTSNIQAVSGYTKIAINNTTGSILDLLANDTRQASVFFDSSGLQLQTLNSYPMIFKTVGGERMRIDSSGNLLVGTTSTGGNDVGFRAYGPYGSINSVTNTADYSVFNKSTSTTGTQIQFRSANSTVGSISSSSTTTTYATSSDYRLKENIAPMTGALAVVQQLKPSTYTWKTDGSDGQGFIAHELQEVVPECVTGEKDAVDAEGNPVYQGIDTSFLVATLTAAIQEQQAIIEQLRADVAALKAKA